MFVILKPLQVSTQLIVSSNYLSYVNFLCTSRMETNFNKNLVPWDLENDYLFI